MCFEDIKSNENLRILELSLYIYVVLQTFPYRHVALLMELYISLLAELGFHVDNLLQTFCSSGAMKAPPGATCLAPAVAF